MKKIKSNLLKFMLFSIFLVVIISFSNNQVYAAPTVPSVSLNFNTADGSTDMSDSIELLLFFTILSILPSILLMMTCFTRIAIILSFLKQAIGAQQSIPSQVMVGLALFLTFFIMAPVGKESYDNGLKPYFDKQITQEQAIERSMVPIRKFMFKQTRQSDIKLFLELSKDENLKKEQVTLENIPNSVLLPAFTISELKTGFQVGFLLFIPFIVIDMVVSSTLMPMGMMMLPPTTISMPFKILLFIMVDGWDLVIGNLVKSFVK